MSNDPTTQLASIVAKLVGTTCWKVNAIGGAFGSHFTLDFGAKRERRLTSEQLSLMQSKYYGELGVQVQCAAWRVDRKVETVTSSADLSTPEGPMLTGLRLLKGRIVTAAEITRPGMDLLLEFDSKYFLRVFCDQFEDPYDNYTVSFGDTYVTVQPRSRVISEEFRRSSGGVPETE